VGFLVAVWTVNLQNRAGGAVQTGAPVSFLRAVWSLDGPGSFEAGVPEDYAANWLAGQRRVVLLRDAVAKWAGWHITLEESDDSADDTEKPFGTELRAAGYGLAGIFERRVVHGNFDKFMTVATTIAWNLIQHAQAQSDGDYGFTLGTVVGTAPARTKHFCDGDFIDTGILDLAQKDTGGFHWEITPTGVVNFWVGGRGSASGVTLTRSQARTWNVTNDTGDIATVTSALGTSEQPCGAPLVIRTNGLASTYGRLESVVDIDSNDSAEMNEHADDDLKARLSSRLRVRATFRETQLPWAWGAVWLGDTLTINPGAHFGGSQTFRVIEVAATVEPPDLSYIEYELEVV
jgi:hypothetical protein